MENNRRNYIDMAQTIDLKLPRLSDILLYKSIGKKRYERAEKEIISQGRTNSLPEYIYFEYYFNNRSVNSLAKEFRIARNNITHLMKKLGLPRRSLEESMSGENNPMYGKKGSDHPWFGQKHTKKSLKIMNQKLKAYLERQANNTC